MKRPLFLLALAIALVSGLQGYGCRKQADAWVEPPVFASRAGELNVVLIAKPASVTLGGWSTTGWVYQACRRLSSAQQDCPPGSGAVQPYGGVRLQLQPGDVLRIRLVNQLPPTPADAEHLGDMPTMLAQNPTNLHTHGLIVEPRNKTALDPTYGDYVYVLGYPAQSPPGMLMPGLDATTAPIDYAIDIPGNHPSGIYWFHPHVHGLSLNQISAGLSGMITVGAPGDYVASLADSDDAQPRIRHLMLKDLQVLPEGRVYTQENPRFCAPTPAAGEPPRAGFCPGGPSTDADGKPVDYSGGRWFFTVSGQLDPRLQVDPNGELWRLVNASGSRSYVLQLRDGGKGAPLPFQVVSLDGVALDPGTTDTGGRLTPTPCPPPAQRGAVCADSLRMMPSTRAELWIPGAGPTSRASLVTMDFSTGLDGDHWPAVELAQVEWKAKISQRALSTVQTLTSGLSAGRTVFAEATARLPSLGRLVSLASWPRSAAPALAAKSAATPAAACTPLARGTVAASSSAFRPAPRPPSVSATKSSMIRGCRCPGRSRTWRRSMARRSACAFPWRQGTTR